MTVDQRLQYLPSPVGVSPATPKLPNGNMPSDVGTPLTYGVLARMLARFGVVMGVNVPHETTPHATEYTAPPWASTPHRAT